MFGPRVGHLMVLERAQLDLCIGCGMCSAVCTRGALRLVEDEEGLFKPEVAGDCNDCGLCDSVCPIIHREPNIGMMGSTIGCYLAHSMDHNSRWAGASGGVVSSIIGFLLREDLVGGVLAVRNRDGSPYPDAGWVLHEEDVVECRGSYYCTVPLNAKLGDLPSGVYPLAFVGLPCQVRALRMAQRRNNVLKKRIRYVIGLFCGGNATPEGTRSILRHLGVDAEEVRGVYFRGEGWPGRPRVEMQDGSEVEFDRDLFSSVLFSKFFTPLACSFCDDGTAEMADISVGDPWIPEMSEEKIGRSIVLVRTGKGFRLLKRAGDAGVVAMKPLSGEKVISAQKEQLAYKKLHMRARVNFLSATNKKFRETPLNQDSYRLSKREPSFLSILFSFFPFVSRWLGSNPLTRRILDHIPIRLLTIFHRTQSALCSTERA